MLEKSWDESDDLAERLGEEILGRVRAGLEPSEYLLWADRPRIPPAIRVRVIPTLFVVMLAGLSGFSLAAIFGVLGDRWINPLTLALTLCLAPCVLGCLIAADMSSRIIAALRKAHRLARMVYAITDRRAIVARIRTPGGELTPVSLRPGMVRDTCRFEAPDGTGDLLFLGFETESWLPFGFIEVPRVGQVESLVREILLGPDVEPWQPDWFSAD